MPRRQTRWPAGRWEFQVAGLQLAGYEMRVFLDVRKRRCIKPEVDLRELDLDFDPILLNTYDDFFSHREFDLGARH